MVKKVAEQLKQLNSDTPFNQQLMNIWDSNGFNAEKQIIRR